MTASATSSLKTRASLPVRTRLALLAGRGAAGLSQLLGRGRGSVIGGRVTTLLDGGALAALSRERTVVLITGTNGKSTTSRLVAEALCTAGPVALNDTGSNMDAGLVAALDQHRHTHRAVLEVDEAHLGPVTAATRPRVVVLMNLSREYTRGVTISKILRHWRDTLAKLGSDCTVVANVDDPLVAWAAEAAGDRPSVTVVPVSAGLLWRQDAVVCRRCGARLAWDGPRWSCPSCGRARPEPVWTLAPEGVRGRDSVVPVDLRLPGAAVRSGAVYAFAVAAALGIDAAAAAGALHTVDGVDGRYAPYPVGAEHSARLFVVKNPAGWGDVVELSRAGSAPLVLCVEAFGPKDTAVLWDAPAEHLAGRRVTVTGHRRLDVAAWLETGGAAVDVVADPLDAIRRQPPGLVDVAVNYRAFGMLRRMLRA